MTEIPIGMCQCGCGEPTRMALRICQYAPHLLNNQAQDHFDLVELAKARFSK
jgi:hypothetical protein